MIRRALDRFLEGIEIAVILIVLVLVVVFAPFEDEADNG